jgi:hypothetical protein
MDIEKLAAAMTEHLEDGDERKDRIEDGLMVLQHFNGTKPRAAAMTLNKYTMAGLVRLVTRSHRLDVPIHDYARDLHVFFVDALGVQPDGSFGTSPLNLSLAPRYQEADPESDLIANMIDIFQEKY